VGFVTSKNQFFLYFFIRLCNSSEILSENFKLIRAKLPEIWAFQVTLGSTRPGRARAALRYTLNAVADVYCLFPFLFLCVAGELPVETNISEHVSTFRNRSILYVDSVSCRFSKYVVEFACVRYFCKMNWHKVTRSKQTHSTRKDTKKKRRQSFNPKTLEMNNASFMSTSSKKLKTDDGIRVPENANVQYAIIDFLLVFTTLASFVNCSNVVDGKVCGGKVEFKQCSKAGLGFKIMVECENCAPRYISSCERIGHAFIINRRFILVMRILGLGLAGCNKFCGLMDISSNFLNHSTYDVYVTKIYECVKMVAEKLFTLAAKEEKALLCQENGIEDTTNATVSGDGT